MTNISRRDFLRAVRGAAFWMTAGAGALASGCGGGSSSSPPDGTIPASGTVILSEIGGSGLQLVSTAATDSMTTAGAFATVISRDAVQVLCVSDAAENCRAIHLATPQSAASLTIDATSTAVALVFLTPGILAFDPAVAAKRFDSIKALPSFPALAASIRENGPTLPIPEIPGLGGMVAACVEDWAASGISGAVAVAGFEAAVRAGATAKVAPFDLSNSSWRFVSAFRVNVDGSGAQINPTVETVMLGAEPVAWDTLFWRTAGNADTEVDIADLSSPGLSTVQYWVNGPGFLPTDLALPALPNPKVYGYTIIYYLLFPVIDMLMAGSNNRRRDIKKLEKVYAAGEAIMSAGINQLMAGVNSIDTLTTILKNLFIALITDDGVIHEIVNPNNIKALQLIEKQLKKLIGLLNGAMGISNVIMLGKTLITLPEVAMVDVDVPSDILVTVG